MLYHENLMLISVGYEERSVLTEDMSLKTGPAR